MFFLRLFLQKEHYKAVKSQNLSEAWNQNNNWFDIRALFHENEKNLLVRGLITSELEIGIKLRVLITMVIGT